MKTLLIKLAYTNYCWGSSEDEGLSDTNLSYKQKKNYFANVSTECCSRHWGESGNWSNQLKRQ